MENKAEPKPSCHSTTGVLTIIGCHRFLIRPVSKKCGNKTVLQKEHPRAPPLHTQTNTQTHTHRYSELCYLCTRTSHRDMRTHQTCQKVVRTDPENKTGLVTQYTVNWLLFLPVLQGYPKKQKGSVQWHFTLTADGGKIFKEELDK